MSILRMPRNTFWRTSLRCGLVALFTLFAFADEPVSPQRFIPPELQVADPGVKALLNEAETAANNGDFGGALGALQKALDFTVRLQAVGDKAIVEDHLGVYYFSQGKLEDAKSQWLNSFSDGAASSNLALQSDVLVALSTLQQTSNHLPDALDAVNRALDLARKAKSPYMQSRVLGELSRLQLLAGKESEARSSIEEALNIDRSNGYDWEAGHLLYLANINVVESKTDKAIEIGVASRSLAIKKENYLVFVQSSVFLGQGLVRTGHAQEGLRLIELSQKGLLDDNQPAFKNPSAYARTTSLPYFKVVFEEALATAYDSAKRPDDALKHWQLMYDSAAASTFDMALGESSKNLADHLKVQKDFNKAIQFYAKAADAFYRTGNEQDRIGALTSEEVLLFQQGEKQRALQVEEDLLSLARASQNVQLRFISDLVIAEILNGDEPERTQRALEDAESLVGPSVTVPSIKPDLVAELYIRLATFYGLQKDKIRELISLEKAVSPALSMASAEASSKNDKPLMWIFPQLRTRIADYGIADAAEHAYSAGDFTDALVYFELLRYFQELDAGWNNKYSDYLSNLGKDPVNSKLLQIPGKVIAQDDGAAVLTRNIQTMGPIADSIRVQSVGILTAYYMSHQQPKMVIQLVRENLASLNLGTNQMPTPFDVAMSCQLATAFLLEKDLNSALDALTPCMDGAKKLGNPQLLQAAHQTNAWVLDAAGKHEQAQESIQFLVRQAPDEPLAYVQLAQVKAQQQDTDAAADAWRTAIRLYEARKDFSGAADAHFALAGLLALGGVTHAKECLLHLEAADKLYEQLNSSIGRINAESGLGLYYAHQKKSMTKSRDYFEGALKLARDAKRIDLEAYVSSQMGLAYDAIGNLSDAAEQYRKAADLFEQQKDLADAAFQLKNLAVALDNSRKPDDALQTILKAEAEADESTAWRARYWVRRTLADLYQERGEYQKALVSLSEAKQISEAVHESLTSAWTTLELAGVLETLGDWEAASNHINDAIPTLKKFNDVDDEARAYTDLMSVYGARESDLKDFDKALQFYSMARQLVEKTHPEQVATLNLELAEIYWNQGEFKAAIAKSNEALEYFRKTQNELGQASALLSLAEAQRSNGDLASAEKSLALAEPLVKKSNQFYTIGRLHYGRAAFYRAQGRIPNAVAEYEQVIQMLEQFKSGSDSENRRHVSEDYAFIYDELIASLYELSKSDKSQSESAADKALQYAELNKARAFSNSWGHAFADGLRREVPIALQHKEASLTAQRDALQRDLQAAFMGSDKKNQEQVQQKLKDLDANESEFEEQLWRTSPAYAEVRYPRPIDIHHLPMSADELLVQFKVMKERTLVWVLSGSTNETTIKVFYRVERPRTWFAERIFRLRDAFNGGHPEQFDSTLTDELCGALFPSEVQKSLGSAKEIIFVPDDVLFLVPLEMLSVKGQYFLLDKPTEYFPSSAALRLARTSIHSSKNGKAAFIGVADPITSSSDPRFVVAQLGADSSERAPGSSSPVDKILSRGFSLERIPATADEVQNIASLFSKDASIAEVRTGIDATKRKLLRTDLSRFNYIHFATHGILPVEAGIKEPALVLSYDGGNKSDMLLTLSDILQIKLHADLVVLSACNTGSGTVTKAEGVSSLGSAFLAAGASSVTVSLWQVADSSTSILMQEFYKNLAAGKSKAAALAAARSVLVSKGYDNPFFWAPFILTGE